MSKPGERKLEILRTLAAMLESPRPEKITTAALAARVEVSEAALYRHFASKAQMYEGLIEFIEQTLFGLINKIAGEEPSGLRQTEAMTRLLLAFAEKNRGMTRMLTGEALVNENVRLQTRVNQLLDRVESSLKQALRIAATRGEIAPLEDAAVSANLLLCWVQGRWQQFVKSGFARSPLARWEDDWALLSRMLA